MLEEQYGQMERLRHDMKNHMIGLQGLLKNKEWGKMEIYLNQMLESGSMGISEEVTGNRVADVQKQIQLLKKELSQLEQKKELSKEEREKQQKLEKQIAQLQQQLQKMKAEENKEKQKNQSTQEKNRDSSKRLQEEGKGENVDEFL